MAPNKKRGLIDAIGSIAKSLFGTMDVDDDRIIREQLTIVHDENAVAKHAVKNQLKVINSTIEHIDNLERTLQENQNTLTFYIDKLKEQGYSFSRRHDLDEHFTLLTALTDDLLRDATETIDYINYIKEGILHPTVMPIEDIIVNLKEAITGLPKGLYFPFNLNIAEWVIINKITKINAYYNHNNIYTILRFPLTTSPTYELIHVTSVPVYDHDEKDERECIKINSDYLCERNYIVKRINKNSICEVQMYLNKENHYDNCENIFITSPHTLWTKLRNVWIYSVADKETVTIKCEDSQEVNEIIANTGTITLQNNCTINVTKQ
ncbi:hypothetical protein ALC57_01120 [Trachymyrmex cornetzi]|uniref:Envelope fusion protein n=1 Tax=Trachymyrmex cornetzi TaxID=471704 RepID=A0A151JQE9_9HYME|nr:hypothetical protein ALC57_01120 [Trachymyrmex cornetzi]